MDYTKLSKKQLIDLLENKQAVSSPTSRHEFAADDCRSVVVIQNCHEAYGLIVNDPSLSFENKLQKIATLLAGFLSNGRTCGVCICLDDLNVSSPGFEREELIFSQKMSVAENQNIGAIEVSCRYDTLQQNRLLQDYEQLLVRDIAIRSGGLVLRYEADTQLENQLNKYEYLLDSINEIVYEYDDKGILTYVSNGIYDCFGYKPEVLIGSDFGIFLNIKDVAFRDNKLRQLRNDKHIQTEYHIHTPLGERWVNLSTTARFENERFAGGTGILTDITKIKATELELNRTEKLYHSILESSPDNIFITDLNANILLCSKKVHELFLVDSYVDFTTKSLLDFISVDERERFVSYIGMKMQGIEVPDSIVFKILRTDNSSLDLEIKGDIVFNDKQVPENLIFIFRDITRVNETLKKLEKAEEKYRNLVESLNEIIYEIDERGIVQYVSPAIRIMGYSPDEMIGNSFLEFTGKHRNTLYGNLMRIKVGEVVQNEYDMPAKNGDIHWLRFSTKAKFDDDGRFRGGMGTMIDVTEQRKTEKELMTTEILYSTMLNVLPDAIALCDVDGTIEYTSPVICKMLGCHETNSFKGRLIFDFLAQEDRERAIKNSFLRIAGVDVGIQEYKIVKKDGSCFDCEINSAVIFDKDTEGASQLILTLRDISPRKKMEQELRKSEEKYRLITEKISDVVWLMDLEGNSIFVSRSIENFTGFTAEEYMQQTIQKRFTPESALLAERIFRDEIRRALSAGFKPNETVTLELDYSCKDENVKTGELLISALVDDRGQLIGLHGVTRDITARKNAERALKESESRYRNIFESVQDAYYEASINGVLLDISPSIFRISQGRFKREDLLGKSFVNFYRDPHARSKLQNELFTKGEVVDYEIELFSDDVVVPVAVTSSVLVDVQGIPNRIIGSIRDISERKKAEHDLRESQALYHSVLMASPDDITIADLSGNILFVSPAGVGMFGYGNESEMLEMNVLSFICEPDRSRASDAISSMFVGIYERPGKYTGLRKDASLFPMEVNAEFIRDSEGNPKQLMFIVRDVTERERADKALRLSEEKYKSLIDSADASIVMVDNDGKYLFVNAIAATPFSKSPGEITGTSMQDYFTAPDVDKILPHIQQVLKTCQGEVIETELVFGDELQWFRSALQPVRNEQNVAYAVLIYSTNITDIILANRRLVESELRYKTFFEGNKSTILLIEPKSGDIKDANPAACEYYGWSKDELCQLNIRQINTLPYEDILKQLEYTKHGQRKMHDFKHRLKDGTIRNVEVYAGPMDFGKETLVYSIIHDVTERKLFEEKLQESEARFRMIFENVYDGICIYEENEDAEKRKLVNCNEQYARMAGRSRDELLEIAFTSGITKSIDLHSNESRIKGLRSGEAYQGAFKWIRPDAKENYIQYIAKPILWEGKTYSIGIDRDITEMKDRENQLRKFSLVVEQSPVSIVITDLSGNIEYANPEACKTSGYSSDELIGKNPRVFKSGQLLPESYVALWKNITHGKQWKGRFHNRKKNGELYWESSTVSPIIDDTGGVVGYVAIKEDVTAKMKADEELKKFRTISDKANYGTVITSVDGLILYLNDAWARMHGADCDYYTGKEIRAFHNEEQQVKINELLKRLSDNGEFVAEEVWHTRLDGTTFPTLMSATVIRNEKEEPIFFTATAIDISEIIRSELALRESEANLNFAQQIAKLGSWMIDFDSHETVWSENIYRILGLEPYANVDLDEYFYSHVHPDDLKQVDLRNGLDIINENTKSLQIRFIMPDGSLKWLQGDMMVVRKGDKICGLKGVFLDITLIKEADFALRNSEMNLNYAQHVAKMGSWKIDLKTNTVEWSENEYRMLGQEPFAALDLRQYFRDNIYEEDRFLQDKVWQFVQINKLATTEEFRFVMPDKSIKWIQGDVSPIFENDEMVAIIGTHIDVTDKKIAEKALVESEARLNYAQEISKMCSWEFDGMTKEMVVSQNFYKIHHIDPSLTGIELYEITQERIHPDDRFLRDNLSATGFPNGKTQTIETRILVGNEQFRWIRGFIIPEYKDGSLVKLRGVNIDITEQKQKDEQIKKLNQAVGQSPVAVLITDVNGTIEYVNPAFVEITGYSSADVIGCNTRILKSGQNPEKVYRELWDTILGGHVWEAEWINKKKNDELYWEHISISPVFDTSNRIVNFMAIKQDISSRKKFENDIVELNSTLEQRIVERTKELEESNLSLLAEMQEREKFEKALKDSEFKYRSVVQNVEEVIFQIDKDGMWLFLNKSWETITGFSVEESVGNLFLNYVHPDDRQLNSEMFSVLMQRKKEYCQHEIRYLTKNGGFRWIEVFARLGIDENDEIIGSYGSLRDVTESKLAKELLEWNKSLLEMMSNSSPLGFLVVDNRTDEILYFNRRFCEIWGIQALEKQMKNGELKNNDLIPYCLPLIEDVPAFTESCKPLQDENNRIVVSDEILFRGNRTIHRYSTQIRGSDDHYYGRFYIFEDVTDVKVAEGELIKARNEADEANRAKSEFLSRMSHELRTPLNSILGFAQLLEMGDLTVGQIKSVAHINKSGRHLLSLINDVLDISRIESGRVSMSIEPVPLQDVFEEVNDLIRPFVAEPGIRVNIEPIDDALKFVIADKQSLKQILLNLMNNSVKYNVPGGSITLKTQLVEQPSGKSKIRILVKDSGIGIPGNKLSALFTPFERVGADKSGIEGTGLGLAVVKKLTELMHGEVGVESTPGVGSTFWIQLDIPEVVITNNELGPEAVNPTLPGAGRKGTVLYVEDNESNIEFVRQLLAMSRPGIRVEYATDGIGLIDKVVDIQPDIVLMDLNLPEISGSDLLTELKNDVRTSAVPVVILSADAMQKRMNELLKLGAYAYITKPIDINGLLSVLDEIISFK